MNLRTDSPTSEEIGGNRLISNTWMIQMLPL
jgi:hypothetical protein